MEIREGKASAGEGSFPLGTHLPRDGKKGRPEGSAGPSLSTLGSKEGLEDALERARRFETLNLLVRKINSTFNLPDLLKFIADSARELLGVARINILLSDDTFTYLTLTAFSGVGASGPFPEKTRFRIGKEGLYAKRIKSKRPFFVEDLLGHPDLVNRELYRRLGVRSYLSVPMLVGGRPVGCVSCFTQVSHRFSRGEVKLFSLFADHAALAVERTRLHERIAREARQSALVARVTQAVNSISEFDDLLEVIGEEIRKLVDFDHANILLRDRAAGLLKPISLLPDRRPRTRLRPFPVPERDSCAGWVLRTGRPWIRQDLKTERRFAEDTELFRQGTRSSLVVPLRSHGRRIGTLNLRSLKPNHFTPQQAEVLGLVTDQIAIAIERARLYESTTKELKEIKALSASARKITSELDLGAALEGIAKESLAVLDADRCAIILVDEDKDAHEFRVSVGLSKAYREAVSRAWKEFPGRLPLHRALLKGKEFVVPDAHKDPSLEPIRDLILQEGYQGLAAFPLRSRKKTLGALIFYHDERRPYSRSDRQLARAFARQAAIAILNAKLYQDLANERSRLESLSHLARKITSTLDPRDVLKAVVEAAGILLDVSISRIFLVKEGTEELILQTAWGMPWRKALDLGRQLRVGVGLIGWTAKTRLPLVVEDVPSDPHLINREAARQEGLGSYIGVPLLSGGRLLGVLACFSRQRRRFTQDDQRLLQALADEAVIAIQNARLYQEAKEAKDYLTSLVENAGEAIITVTRQGRIISWNNAAEALYGYKRKQALGRAISLIYPRNRRGEMKALRERGRKGEVVRNYETQRRRKDGTLVDVSLTISPILDARGRFVGLSGLHEDISERKRAEELLRESEGRFRGTFDQAAVGIAHVGIDGRWLRVNQKLCDILGYTPKELRERTFQEITHPNDLGPDLENVRRLLAKEIPTFSMEKRYIRKDGSQVWVDLTVSLVRDASGEPKYTIAVVEDISERKRAQEALAQAQAQVLRSEKLASIGQLTAGACHEILNPLNIISMQAQLALAGPDLSPDLRKKFQTTLEQVHRIAKMTDNLRRFSRKETPALASLQVNEVLHEVLSLFRHELPLVNIHLREELTQELPPILGDKDQLSQVFLNLISNAKDAMPKGGSLTVSSQAREMKGKKTVVVSFSDTGCGIPRQNLPKIFDPFFTTKPQDQGTGLGLSVCYGIVESHGGRIDVENEEGKGATFRVELPALAEETIHVEDLNCG